MEFGFLAVVAASAMLGFALRGSVSPTLGRVLVAVGLTCIVLAIGILGLIASAHSPVSTMTGGRMGAVALGAAGLLLPFGLVVGWRRF
jgi:hypothetical protein